MADAELIAPLLLALCLVLLSAMLTWMMVRIRILYHPNHRSSHARPVPNGGGVAIVATFLVGYAAIHWLGSGVMLPRLEAFGLALAALGIAAVSFLDDVGRLKAVSVKLLTQLAAATMVAACGIVFRHVQLPWVGGIDLGPWGYPLTILWIVCLTNIFNFMDGLDGLAGGMAVIVAFFLGVIGQMAGAEPLYQLAAIVFSATLGFLFFNFPRARIFMGDVGSQFLGFAFAATAVIAAESDAGRISVFVVPLLFMNFIFDTALTVIRRFRSGDDIAAAHRKHLYQLLNRAGFSHQRVSLVHYAMAVLQGVGAVLLVARGTDTLPWIVLPLLMLQIGYAALVLRAARRLRLADG